VTIQGNPSTGAQSTDVTGTVEPVTSALPANTTEVWSFATGTCGSETWVGITPAAEASNAQAFVSAGRNYIVGTGGAAGAFDCPSGAAFISFINTYNSADMVGVDFDIEFDQSQQVIDDLINAAIAAEAQFPNMQFSFTIPTLGGTSNPITVAGETGTLVVSEIQRLGLGGNYVIDLEAMDYGSPSTTNCVVVSGQCEMGQSAVNAAEALHTQTGIPYSHIGFVVDIGQNDTSGEVFTLADVDTITAFALANGLATVRFWSFDRDSPGNPACATGTDSDICNGTGAAALSYTNRFLTDLGLN
jgi:chitinase